MRILNIGSCNIDHVYHVPYFVKPGETLHCHRYEVHPGGKGFNQSVALARAGAKVSHAGKIGKDGLWLKEYLDASGVDTKLLTVADEATGHALIQVTSDGENSIVLFGGTNKQLSVDGITEMMSGLAPGDFVLLQNETNVTRDIISIAADKKLRIVFNAAPMTDEVSLLPFDEIELLIINEVEGEALTGFKTSDAILANLEQRFPNLKVVITLGRQGAVFASSGVRYSVPGLAVTAVDTTGAGDTFTGYFLMAYSRGDTPAIALELACRAAALSVTKAGAASAIPALAEL